MRRAVAKEQGLSDNDLEENAPSGRQSVFANRIALLAMKYGGGRAEMGQALGRSGDGGIDGLSNEDELGLDAVYVQAKRYASSNSVGAPESETLLER